jgi:hypothetical protein
MISFHGDLHLVARSHDAGRFAFLAQRMHLPDEPERYRTDGYSAQCLTLDHGPDFRLAVTTHHIHSGALHEDR